MCKDFTTEFATKLYGKLGSEELDLVLKELYVFASNYNIEEKVTEIVPYNGYLPECYKKFFISKQINGVKKTSLESYNECLKDFFRYTNKSLNEIQTDDIRAFLYYLENVRKVSKCTQDCRRLILNSFFGWCKNEGYISTNPCAKINRIRFEPNIRQPLSNIELERVRYACDNLRDKTLLEFFYSTGCRVQEVVNLNVTDINFEKNEVIVYGKGGKYRTVFLNAKAIVLLEKYIESRQDDNPALFVSLRKPYQRIKKGAMERIIRNIGYKAGIDRNIFPHLIRHTTATTALNRGMDVTEVKEMLGHKKIETTMIYAKVSQINLKQNHERYIV